MGNPEKNIGGALKFIRAAMIGTIIASVGTTYTFDMNKVEASEIDENNIQEVNKNNVEYNVSVASLSKSKFKDVRADHYSYEAILWAQDREIIHGYEDGTFKPQNAVTEAQFAKMVSVYFDLKEPKGKLDKFTNRQTWNDVHYNALAAHGVPLNGYFDDSIRNSVVKRGTVAQVLAYIGGYKMGLNDSINFLLDNKVTVGQNNAFKDKDLLKYFGSGNDLTRAQVVAFLYRMDNNGLSDISSNAKISFDKNSSLDRKASEGKSQVDKSLSVGKNKEFSNNDNGSSSEGNANWNGGGKPGVNEGNNGFHSDSVAIENRISERTKNIYTGLNFVGNKKENGFYEIAKGRDKIYVSYGVNRELFVDFNRGVGVYGVTDEMLDVGVSILKDYGYGNISKKQLSIVIEEVLYSDSGRDYNGLRVGLINNSSIGISGKY